MTKGAQHTIRFHVDDIVLSHWDKEANTKFGKWLNHKCGREKKVEPVRGKRHDFLGMNFDFGEPKALKVDVCGHVDDVVDTFPIKFDKEDASEHPSGDGSCDEGTGKLLNQKDEEQLHTTAAKGLHISKKRALLELKKHGIESQFDIDEFYDNDILNSLDYESLAIEEEAEYVYNPEVPVYYEENF